MKIAVDVTEASFLAAGPVRPVTEFNTQEPKIDQATNLPVYVVPVIMIGTESTDVLEVKVAGKPADTTPGQPLLLRGLVASPWNMGERSGVSFWASEIRVALPRSGSLPQAPGDGK